MRERDNKGNKRSSKGSTIKCIVLLLFLTLLVSCKTTTKIVEVPVETIKKEYIELIKYDSIFSKDSIYIILKGETIYNNKVLYLYKYKYLRDTINITDTIPKIVTVNTVEYTNKLTAILKVLVALGMGFLTYILFLIISLVKKLLNK